MMILPIQCVSFILVVGLPFVAPSITKRTGNKGQPAHMNFALTHDVTPATRERPGMTVSRISPTKTGGLTVADALKDDNS
jgi:hypothetical protein